MSKKVCGYVRVSLEEQLKGLSLEFQEDAIRKYAEQKGYDLVHIYQERGESAKNLERSQLQLMLRDLYNNKFDTVLAWQVDRVSRNITDLLNLIDEMTRKDKSIEITTTSANSLNDNDTFQFVFQGYFATLERKKILERTRSGMEKNFRKGKFNGGRVFGYDVISKELVINKEESKIVKEIFDLRAKGKGYKAIALYLNEIGCKTKRGNPFSINGIKAILNNAIYIGYIKWGEYKNWSEKRRAGKTEVELVEGIHKPIISMELWDKVQEVNKRYREKSLRNRTIKGELLLTGILRCPQCGYGTVMHKSKGHIYYMCQKYHNYGKTECRTNLINKEFIEKKVEEVILEIIKNGDILTDMIKYEEIRRDSNTDLAEYQLSSLEKKITRRKETIEKLDNDLLNNYHIMSDYEKHRNAKLSERATTELEELEEQKEFLAREIAVKKGNQLNETEIRKLFKNFEKVYYSTDRLTKKKLLRALIKRIEVSKDRKSLNSIEFWFFPNYSLPLGEIGRTVP
ncbi:recombinase family protein [Ornithinibacillus halophilus]|uniref:Site-specific DNA recombinase n=1 Tax=Ornithinibacillus halophilus TaxID=930117 RepID=A0A1M5G3K3_9BACI|nr:recombinase family protein [Ornithinibacillus halophilus]SHF98296.1 site-specific DNA recombinase [Ornithinibacillus halophilus]